jgi:probable addiction module antidote protein
MKSKKASVSHRERLIEELKRDPALSAEYLNVAAEGGDAQSYLLALRTVAEAQGMSKVAKAAGVPRESIYRALSPKGNPRLSDANGRAQGRRSQDDRSHKRAPVIDSAMQSAPRNGPMSSRPRESKANNDRNRYSEKFLALGIMSSFWIAAYATMTRKALMLIDRHSGLRAGIQK